MSGLQNFLAPFSHLLFWNRNLDIVVLCFVLFGVALLALINHWRANRLERDLTAARSTASLSPAGRRYAAAQAAPEPAPVETGGALPPVKGGRTYARNLGSALQKAGMSQPIYSPPTPAGWTPQTNPSQPGAGQPGMTPPPYGAPNVPWAATPPAAPPAPWAFPAGSGRNMPGPAPSSAPFYQPQQPMPPQMPPAMGQPPAGPGPNVYSPPPPGYGAFPPPPMTGPFAPPAFSTPSTSGPAAPAPSFSPPIPNPMMPPLPPMPAPTAEPAGSDGGRRGKPKRRRFNFNVLENLEKMVQSKPAEPLPPTSWTPPAAPPAPAPTPAQATFSAIPQTSPPAPAPTPSPTEATPAPKPAEEAPVGLFQLGKRGETPEVSKPAEPAATEPVLNFSAPAAEESPAPAAEETPEATTAASDSQTEAPVEQELAAEPEPKRDARRSMRSMMFGEEPSSSASAAPAAPEPATAEPSPEEPATTEAAGADSDTTWPSYPWNRREEASSSVEPKPTASDTQSADEATVETSHEPEPVVETSVADAYESWKPSLVTEPEPWKSGSTAEHEPEPATVDESQPATVGAVEETSAVGTPDAPVGGDGDKGSAGTVVIIEDDQTAASYYATLFRGNGYHVEVANDGVSGVDLCAKVQPQVILLDVMMPRQNGILVLQTLRASDETKNTPVVVMSNFSEPTLIKRALQLGALEYVIKTQVEGPALLNAVPRWMNREKAFAAA